MLRKIYHSGRRIQPKRRMEFAEMNLADHAGIRLTHGATPTVHLDFVAIEPCSNSLLRADVVSGSLSTALPWRVVHQLGGRRIDQR